MPELDYESKMYEILEKGKKNGIYKYIGPFTERVLNIFEKRFGGTDYVAEMMIKNEDDVINQLEDCVNHVIKTNDDAKKIFDFYQEQDEKDLIISMIFGIMWESKNETD